ncbi:hypothetical protein AQUCO_01400750v1 [Aquilegia coerulea]|uniref:VOC domain-containing protein n=1 Tax=Aquilegia coerulea TaxID=218851 RepID=A0A2G5DXW7_AQUCA|nr:hypothetical protein AQUCO_01400750v1 [Aquilegia coerulea]
MQEERIENGEKKQEKAKKNEEEEEEEDDQMPLISLNHVSRLCRSVKDSVEFYTKVLGFVLTKRPETFDFDGAWLFNYGIGIHLVQTKDDDTLPDDTDHLDPQDNHISFQCEDLKAMEQKLKNRGIKYLKRIVEDENGTAIDQLFFNDPDGFMIEICNCENLKLVPADAVDRIKLPSDRHIPPVHLSDEERSEYSTEL